MGMSAPSDRPMTFAENIARPFHVARVATALKLRELVIIPQLAQ
jgi:hypothetical protein